MLSRGRYHRPRPRRCVLGRALVIVAALSCACTDYELLGRDYPKGGDDTACAVVGASAYDVSQDDACSFEREPGGFEPTVEWQWSSASAAPGYEDVMMMPAVGDVDADGVPEVVFTAYAGTGYTAAGALVILSGDGSGEEAAWTDIGGYSPCGAGGVALGDLEGDGTPEIVVVSADQRLLALHADGTLLWATEQHSADFGVLSYPAIADMDGDGLAEVTCGRAIFDHQGALLGVGAHGQGGSYGISAVADLDLDGDLELVVGNAAYRRDGSALWSNGLPDGWTAVGDFDGDGLGEVVSVPSGAVYLSDTDGSLIWGPLAVPGGGGGPPTVADFDGDGAPEVGVAGYSGYVVYDGDGTQLWLTDTQDHSSARTGSSVFDFEGDGRWEVVYADEVTLWVYDGATGAPVLEETGHSSWTLYEYPVLVDVDADGETEIVLASNDSIASGWQGITVIGDASGTWAPSAQVWNQHAYHITNVEDDLSIPAAPAMNWLTGHNSYRAGGLRERPGIPAPDLRPSEPDICWYCDEPAVSLGVQVENRGTADVSAPVNVSVYARQLDGTRSWLGAGRVEDDILAGRASETLVFDLALPELGLLQGLTVEVDDNGTSGSEIEECDEDDNGVNRDLPDDC